MTSAKSAAKAKLTTLDLVYTALFTVLMAACAWISIPMPKPLVPFSMQTFGVFAALLVLGGRRGTLAVTAYLLLGAVGAPVFIGFRGGLEVLLGSTGGYILGFFASALVYWLVTALLGERTAVKAAACLLGLGVCYAFGTAWFMVVYARANGPIGLSAALAMCVIPFLLPDAVKLALALLLAQRVSGHIKT